MKKVVIVCLVICLLAIAGCGKKAPVSSSATQPTSSNATKKSEIPTESATASAAALAQRRSVALKAFSDVMLNNAKFYDADSKRTLYLKDIKWSDTSWGLDGPRVAFHASNFAVVDMDGDGVSEVVVGIDPASNADVDPGFEVLHYTGSKVNGFSFHFRSMQTVGTNGLYTEGGATNNSTEKLRFIAGTYDISRQYYSESVDGTEDGKPVYFYYHDVPLSENSYEMALKDDPYEQVHWYDFKDSLIKKWVTDRPASADSKPALSNDALVARQNYLDGLESLTSFQPEKVNPFADYLQHPKVYYQNWDKELNKIYGLLEKKLTSDQMDVLRSDEKQWLSVRDIRGAQAYQNYIKSYSNTAVDASYEESRILGDVTKNRTFYLIDRYFGDTSQPTTTEIIQKYGLKK